MASFAQRLGARLRWAALLAPLALAVPACAADDEVATGDDEVTSGDRTIAVDDILDDADIEGGTGISVGKVQAFLEAKGSALATYEEGGRSAAAWIVDESRAERISPLYMLARLETESGIVSSGTLKNIRSATGCGCPDTAACDPKYANFGPQVRCAAKLMRGYFSALETKKATVSGWRVGAPKTTLDPCEVSPKNKATAALYTYNPWVGAYGVGCGSSKWGGATLIGRLFRSYARAFPDATGAPAKPAPRPDPKPGPEPAAPAFSDAGVEPETTPRPAAGAACTVDGLHCGGNGVLGEPDELYRCTGGKATRVETCAKGCIATPPGGADLCRP